MADISKFTADSGTTVYDFKDSKARDIVAPDFSSKISYPVGDYCIYDRTFLLHSPRYSHHQLTF